jgi:hypothetical protein
MRYAFFGPKSKNLKIKIPSEKSRQAAVAWRDLIPVLKRVNYSRRILTPALLNTVQLCLNLHKQVHILPLQADTVSVRSVSFPASGIFTHLLGLHIPNVLGKVTSVFYFLSQNIHSHNTQLFVVCCRPRS